MKISYPHNGERTAIRDRIEAALDRSLTEHGSKLSKEEHEWTGDTLRFNATASGIAVIGTLKVTETDVEIDAKVPLFARPFEGQAKSRIIKALDNLLG